MNLQEIINSGYNANIVECGHGAGIAHTLLSQPGASKFMYLSSQPYNKAIQKDLYGDNYDRSVSLGYIYDALLHEHMYLRDFTDKPFTMVTSFQLDGGNELTHGYVGIMKDEDNSSYVSTIFYHLSFYRGGNNDKHTYKSTWIHNIKTEILNILYCNIFNKPLFSTHIDGVYDQYCKSDIKETIRVNSKTGDDNFLCFTNKGIVRFEDVIRLNKDNSDRGIILQKGSFNPIHRMHVKIGDDAKSKYPNYPHVLMLSMNTCDKGFNDESILAERVDKLLKLGYIVMVSKDGMFVNNVKKIRGHYKDLSIVFPVGEDTIERFFRDWEDYFNNNHLSHMKHTTYTYDFKNVTWYISKRDSITKHFGVHVNEYSKHHNNFIYSELEMDPVSSTQIRNGTIINEIESCQ